MAAAVPAAVWLDGQVITESMPSCVGRGQGWHANETGPDWARPDADRTTHHQVFHLVNPAQPPPPL